MLGDAAHPTLQYLAHRACMTLKEAVTLGGALRLCGHDTARAFAQCEKCGVAGTARIVLSVPEMGRLFHAKGVERLVRNDRWKGRTDERFYGAMEWLYGWKVENCIAAREGVQEPMMPAFPMALGHPGAGTLGSFTPSEESHDERRRAPGPPGRPAAR